jgi:hypothetical protein
MDLRDHLGRLYYDDDYIERELSVFEETEFLGEKATKVIGVWQNEEEVIGGPFQFIAFNHGSQFYMIDMGAYAPDRTEKLEYLFRGEIIARTFEVD